MIALQLRPDRVCREVTQFNMKLARGIKTLRDVDELEWEIQSQGIHTDGWRATAQIWKDKRFVEQFSAEAATEELARLCAYMMAIRARDLG